MISDRTLKRAEPRRRALRSLRVEVLRGPDVGRVIEHDGAQPLSIGTAADNRLVLSDRTVSRYHLELAPSEGAVEVTDLGSLNGTFLGALRIHRVAVPAGTELSLGDTVLRVLDGEPASDSVRSHVVVPGMVAESTAMQEVAAEVVKLAPAAVSVLVQGETGTGKEVVARALHELSDRREGPFVVIDCGSLPATLIASELFGHERGAFTGADRQHTGAFQRAHGGTVFLDEIGELPLAVQPALLGALERRQIRRVGGTADIDVDVRVISATHRDLRAEVNADRFRADLYFRLAVARVVIPPLRERPEDIEPLVRHFVTEITGVGELPFGDATLDALRAHRFSGNVRELRNVVEAAVAMGEVRLEKTRPGVGAAPAAPEAEEGPPLPYKEARAEVVRDFELRYLGRLIRECGGNASEAARVARMDRQYLLGLLRRHDLR